ncbi:rhamnogalacturonan lyase family protein [Microbacterium sp. GXF0217]
MPRTRTRARRHRIRICAGISALALAVAIAPQIAPTIPGWTQSQAAAAATTRPMESLDRGVVAVRASETEVLVSWRSLGLDPVNTTFNVYRSTAGGAAVKLNDTPLTGGTNYTDATADLTRRNSYYVRPIFDGVWQAASRSFLLSADHAIEPAVRVPLRAGAPIKYVWVGDLDGDGSYDYVVDRHGASTQSVEAYTSDGAFLWSMDLGPNSADRDNIEPGSSTIDVGHWDGLTVRDLDLDGTAEVAVRISDGVTFGDGSVFDEYDDDVHQSLAVVDGLTGVLEASAPLPTEYLSDGPLAARLGVGYLDGVTPSVVGFMKNRIGSGDFNLVYSAWTFDGAALTPQWEWHRGSTPAPDGHNTRIIDLDQDGDDEIAEIGFALDGDGTLLYSLADEGIVHGDRFAITDMDASRAGLEGYGVQQNNASGLRDYYYGAKNGNVLWQHVETGIADVGRGMAGDIDDRYSGLEVWAFDGVYNARRNLLTQESEPWPHLGVLWDGDTGMELYNDGRIENWNPSDGSVSRLVSTWTHGAINAGTQYPNFIGDILGDWREEVVMTNSTFDELIVFTTDAPTDTRLYTLAHNPAYRNDMTVKGYLQTHYVDYYLGFDMAVPPRPGIDYVTG